MRSNIANEFFNGGRGCHEDQIYVPLFGANPESHRVVTDLQTLGYRYANPRTIDGQLVVVVSLMVTWVAGGVKYVVAGADRLAGALRARDAARNLEPLMGNRGNRNGRNGNGNGNVGGNGNGNGNVGGNGNGNRNVGGNGYNFRGFMPARECTYQYFLNYQPLSFNRTKGVVGLTRWFEKLETMFHISNYLEKIEATYGMSWAELMKLMTKVYCLINEELVLLCTRMVPNKEEKVKRFVSGLLDNIQGNIIAAKPTKIQDEIRIANNLMDQKLKGYARSQNVARAYTAENNDKKGYVGSLPYCNKCKLHHALSCNVRYGNCKRVGHMTRDCKVTITLNTQRALVGNHPGIVYCECGRPRY
nr:hypothetical protein [Tanacetum cinerariifolium]